MLRLLAMVVQDERVRSRIGDPNVSAQELEELDSARCCGEQLDGAGRNFVRMLAQNDRSSCMPAIARSSKS